MGVKECDCVKARKAESLMRKSGLAGVLNEQTFATFTVENAVQEQMKGKATEYLNRVLSMGEDEPRKPWLYIGGNPGCVDADTEYFTGHGWKRIAEYDGGYVMQYNPETCKASMTIPQRYIIKDADVLYKITTKRGSINQVLSADHNFAYITSKGYMQKKPFREVMETHEKTVNGFSGWIETAFNASGDGIPLTEQEIRIMCAVIADGSFRKGLRQCSVNVKKERKKERMRALLSGVQYKEYQKCNGYSEFRFYAPRREKEFSEYWYGCSNKQLQIITDEVFFWDGWIKGKRRSFFTTVKKTADFVQYALSACGIRAVVSADEREGRTTCYHVIASSGNSRVRMSHDIENKAVITEYHPEDGKQYCFTVETGYLVLRREGRIFITGNCGKTHICTAICGELLKRNVEVVYMQWLDESRRLKSYINEPDFDSLVDKYTDCKVLYIDDLFKQTYHGTPVLSDADIKMAFTIFNARYLQNKPTIISSEWSLESLLDSDEGVFSRVYERCKGFTVNVPRDMKYNYRLARKRRDTA